VQQTIATAYGLFASLCRRGKPALVYATPLAQFAIKKVRAGRRIGSRGNSRDITSPRGAVMKGFRIERLDRFDHRTGEWREALVGTGRRARQTPPQRESIGLLGYALCLDVSARLPQSSRLGKRLELSQDDSDSVQAGSASYESGFGKIGSGFTVRRRRWISLAAEP
jgi:hypothetical protein